MNLLFHSKRKEKQIRRFKVIRLQFLVFFTLLLSSTALAQSSDADFVTKFVTQSDVELNIYFLASDEFLGRDTGTQELDIAARYFATWLQVHGVNPVQGYDTYFQEVPFERLKAPETIALTIGDSVYTKNEHLIALNGFRTELDAPIIVLEYATEAEIEDTDIKGKIVIAKAGLPGHQNPQQYFAGTQDKLGWIADGGGAGLIELYSHPQFPWQVLLNFLGGDRMGLADNSDGDDNEIPLLWMNATQSYVKEYVESSSGISSHLSLTGEAPETFTSRNVIGVLEGTDPELKEEYILLAAHYDHLGVASGAEPPYSSEEIYNGARDNAVGTAAILSAAKYFSENPPKRSVIFAAWTAEERGLLGSSYFADNPMIPLKQIVYNLNIDGAGYNDTTKVTVIGLGRTEADDELISAADAFGLEAIADPAPEQNLFNRSDNVNFARNGIPAPTYSMGLTAFDSEINRYYHQTTDESQTLNFHYITNYTRSFVLAADKIANRDEAPFWLPGDPYEEAGRELYNLKEDI